MKLKFLLINYLLLISCSSMQPSTVNQSSHINFLIHTDNESTKTYGEGNSNWRITTNLVEKKEAPKTFFYNFTIFSLHNEFNISEIKYKYGEYGKWRLLKKGKFLKQGDREFFSKRQTLQKVPITIKKIGVAHKQIFHITITVKNRDRISLALVFGINKCIAKKTTEALCF